MVVHLARSRRRANERRRGKRDLDCATLSIEEQQERAVFNQAQYARVNPDSPTYDGKSSERRRRVKPSSLMDEALGQVALFLLSRSLRRQQKRMAA